jgi:hypothetical protein
MSETQELQLVGNQGAFGLPASFEHAQRVAKMLSSSSLIPKDYQGNIQNTMIALELAFRLGVSPLLVMQNLYIIQGKPSWSSTFIIAAINSCGKFSPLMFDLSGEGMQRGCVAHCKDLGTDTRVESPRITMQMATDEGWVSKPGSKWKTMPELMIRYRAAAFFGRLYCPEIMMGMQTVEENKDVSPIIQDQKEVSRVAEIDRATQMIEAASSLPKLSEISKQIDFTAYPELDVIVKNQQLFIEKANEVAS